MTAYLIRRLLLIPVTLFFILLVNFVIINLAPGDPVTLTEVSPEGGAVRKQDKQFATGSDLRWLQFREHYGLTLPILINLWPWTTQNQVNETLKTLSEPQKLNVKDFDALRMQFGDRSKYVMPLLLNVIEDKNEEEKIRALAARFFVRGGTRQAVLGPNLTEEEKNYNRKVAKDNQYLLQATDGPFTEKTAESLRKWYDENKNYYPFQPKLGMLFESRFLRYLKQVVTLDFGTLRNDSSKKVTSEVVKRFKYSLTLSLIPMLATFVLCQIFAIVMIVYHGRFPDFGLNILFLILYALPIFVAAPFLIEKVALEHTFPFTNIPIPISGFTSPESLYSQMTSKERLFDILQHIFLPLIAITYGSLAASSRLSRTAFLEVSRQDYIRTARAKGVGPFDILVKHMGRNAAITIITSLAGSLGVVLGGSLIVETLFEINGFGKFFYDAVVNRDYNVILFSALAGSFLTLAGYLAADLAYTLLDPRVTLE